MLASFILAASVVQSSLPPIFFVRSKAIYRSYQGTETKLLTNASGPSPSPDGKRLAFIRIGNLHSLDLESNLVTKMSAFLSNPEGDALQNTFPSWDPSSKFLIFSHLDQYSVTRREAISKKSKKPVRTTKIEPLFGSEHSFRSIWNVYWCWADRQSKLKSELNLFLGNETSGLSRFSVVSSLAAAFSPDGKKVAFCRNGDLWMADLDLSSIHNVARIASWDEARVLSSAILEGGTRGTNETNAIFRISWSPDGKLLAISSDRYGASGGADIQVVRADRPSETVTSFPGWDAAFLDSGHLLYEKPYTESQNIWEYSIDSKEEKILIANASQPSVGKS